MTLAGAVTMLQASPVKTFNPHLILGVTMEFINKTAIRPIAIGIVMFGSVLLLTGSVRDAALCMLIPLLLGWLRLLASVAYALTAVTLIAAVAWSVLPPGIKDSARAMVTRLEAGQGAPGAADTGPAPRRE
jgi:hypothetical protein